MGLGKDKGSKLKWEGLGESHSDGNGGGGGGAPPWNRHHPEQTIYVTGSPWGGSLCPSAQTGIYSEVGGRSEGWQGSS